MVKDFLTRWPVVRQILTGTDGTGAEAMSPRTRNLAPKHHGAGDGGTKGRRSLPNLGKGIRSKRLARKPRGATPGGSEVE